MSLTAFDYAGGALLLISGLIGLARGATREIVTVVALVLAAVVAVYALRFTGPIARHWMHAAWLAATAAILFVFILAYVALRLVGGVLTRGVQQTALSGVDRGFGLAIGLARAVVLLGGFALLMNAATPPERMPHWYVRARLYPLASTAGAALHAFAPRGLKIAQDVAPVLENAVSEGATPMNESDDTPNRRASSDSQENTR